MKTEVKTSEKIIDNLNWRYATKKFDSSRNLEHEKLNILKEAVRLSASSYGLQPYEILIIEDKNIKEKLKTASYGQPQITDASHLFVFCNQITVDSADIDAYFENLKQTRGVTDDDIKGYKNFMKNTITSYPNDVAQQWTAKQSYIALGTLLMTAAELKIDVCPMEGFEAEKYNEILGLNKKGLNAAVIAAVGYRSHDDEVQHYAKVRKSEQTLFTNI